MGGLVRKAAQKGKGDTQGKGQLNPKRGGKGKECVVVFQKTKARKWFVFGWGGVLVGREYRGGTGLNLGREVPKEQKPIGGAEQRGGAKK